jgi:hypothetical protein
LLHLAGKQDDRIKHGMPSRLLALKLSDRRKSLSHH